MRQKRYKKPQNPRMKQPDPRALMAIAKSAGLENHPVFAQLIGIAQQTGDWSEVEYMIKDQMPLIQQWTIQNQIEVQKQEADPFYPRPTTENFTGNIPVAAINDPFGEGGPPDGMIMSPGDFRRHMFICGSPGRGKSRGILAMIAALKTVLGDKISIWVFEPAKSFRNFLYPKFKIFTLQDMREDLFRPPTPYMPNYTWRWIVAQIMGTEQQFKIASKNQLISALIDFEADGKPYPTTEEMLEKCRADVKASGSFREGDPIQSLVNRFIGLSEYDRHSRNVHIPIEDLMHMDAVFEIGDSISEIDMFRTAMLLSRLYHYKKHERTDHLNLIIMDEGRDLFSRATTGFGEKELEKQYALARKMNIGFIVATQEPKSVSTTIKANVNTMIAFPLSDGKELMDAAMSLGLNQAQMEFYRQLSAEGHGHAIIKYAGYPTPFPVQFPHVPDPDRRVPDEEVVEYNNEFLKQYEIPDVPTPQTIEPKPDPAKRPTPLPRTTPDEELLMRTIHENPLMYVTQIYKECGFNPNTANKTQNSLIKNGYIIKETVKIQKKGKPYTFMRLTPQAHQRMGIKAHAWNRPGVKHQVYAELVKMQLENDGWTCTLEATANGHPHRMDVYAEKDGESHDYEITIHDKNIQDNITTALENKLADRVIIVADDTDIDKCMGKAGDLIYTYGDALEFRPISEFYI